MALEIDRLCQPISAESPCGSDLEYDADYLALEQASRAKEEQQFGETVIAAEGPNWRTVRELSTALLGRTKDIRVATLLTRASAALDGISGFNDGIHVITYFCEHYWPDVFPLLDADYENDPLMRMNAISSLAGEDLGIREMRQCAFLRGKVGTITGRDFGIALGALPAPAGGGAYSEADLLSILGGLQADNPELLEPLAQAHERVKRLQEVINEKAGTQHASDLRPLIALLAGPAKLVARLTNGDTVPVAGEEGATNNEQSGSKFVDGDIRSRDDAVRALGRVCEYFERHEPSNPAPIFIRRAQRVATMSFLDIIADMAPEGMNQVSNLAGSSG